MGTLDRYQKPGGFTQLLQLIETCAPAKREKLLSMVKEEDPLWSKKIEEKMLTLERIFTWSDEAVAEIAGNLQELTLAIAFHGFTLEQREKFCKSFGFAQKRKIDEIHNTNVPNANDIYAAQVKIIVEVRRLIYDGILRSDKIDPEIFVEDNIEENLKKGLTSLDLAKEKAEIAKLEKSVKLEVVSPAGSTKHIVEGDELKLMRRKLQFLADENTNLKNENQNLKTKIDQIKKLAA